MNFTSLYEQLCKEADTLSLDGFFGESSKELTIKRDQLDQYDFLEYYLNQFISDNSQYGKENVVRLTFLFLSLYLEGFKNNQDKVLEILNAFFKGFPGHPETEFYSSFNDFAVTFQDTKNNIRYGHEAKNLKSSERIIFGQKLTNSYSKGVELIAKILTQCILILKLRDGIIENPIKIHSMNLAPKIELFLKLSKNEYDEIIDNLDRELRNSEAHLNIRFSQHKNSFIYKTKSKDKINQKEIQANEFIFKKLPIIAWVPKAYFNAIVLLVIGIYKKDKFKSIYENYFNIAIKKTT